MHDLQQANGRNPNHDLMLRSVGTSLRSLRKHAMVALFYIEVKPSSSAILHATNSFIAAVWRIFRLCWLIQWSSACSCGSRRICLPRHSERDRRVGAWVAHSPLYHGRGSSTPWCSTPRQHGLWRPQAGRKSGPDARRVMMRILQVGMALGLK